MRASNQVILTLMVAEELKDKTVDFLIEQTQLSGFNVAKIQGFSRKNNQFNIKEQVEGYKDLFRFEIIHEACLIKSLLAAMESLFGKGNYRYWLTPALQLDAED